jgi:hypothetical protein
VGRGSIALEVVGNRVWLGLRLEGLEGDIVSQGFDIILGSLRVVPPGLQGLDDGK